jgi:phasin family protein
MATKQEQQFNEIQKKNLEAAMRLAQLSIENSQRIMELQVGTAKSLFEEGVANAKALSGVKDPAEALSLRTAYAQSTTEKMLSCAREIAEITSKTQAEVGKMVTSSSPAAARTWSTPSRRCSRACPSATTTPSAPSRRHGHRPCCLRADDQGLHRSLPGLHQDGWKK